MRITYVIKPLDFVKVSGDEEYGRWVAKSPIGDFEIDLTYDASNGRFELIKWIAEYDDDSNCAYDHIGYFTDFELAVERANGFLEIILEPYLEDVSDLIEWI